MSNRRYDVRRGLPSASAMHRISKCPGSLALVNRLRAEGKLYQLPNPYAQSGTTIHQWLAARMSEGDSETKLTSAELSVAEKCEELRQGIIEQWINSNI
jgi:hypothetical protein